MLEGLEAVNWGELQDAYGPATHLPQYVRGLLAAEAEARKNARSALANTIGHQGTRYPATPAAVPFLLELLADPATSDRDGLIQLLVFLAIGYEEAHLPFGFDPAAAFAAAPTTPAAIAAALAEDDWEQTDAYWAKQSYEAVLRGSDTLRQLARDPELSVRMAAVRALAWFPAAAARSLPVVRGAAREEADEEERTNAILSLGILGGYLEDTSDASWLAAAASPRRPYLERVTAALSLAALRREALPPSALGVLLDALQDPEANQAVATRVSWHGSGLIAHASITLRFLSLDPTGPALPALCRAAATLEPWPALPLIETLLGLVFRDQVTTELEPDPRSPSGFEVVRRDPASLTEAQRQALRAVAQSTWWPAEAGGFGPFSEMLWSYGLPTDADRFQAFVKAADG
jgi:hypothetical protein